MVDFKQILSVSLILFSVIDILGSIPIIINLRKKVGHIQSEKATIVAGILMVAFLLVGKSILNLFGIGVEDFAIAGALIIFALMSGATLLGRFCVEIPADAGIFFSVTHFACCAQRHDIVITLRYAPFGSRMPRTDCECVCLRVEPGAKVGVRS